MRFLHHTPYDYDSTSLLTLACTPSESSSYWRVRVASATPLPMEAEALRGLVDGLLAFPEAVRLPLAQHLVERPSTTVAMSEFLLAAAGGPIDLEHWRNRLAFEKAEAEASKELVFERVRLEQFPMAPSRMRCLFAIDADQDADAHMKTMGFDVRSRSVLEVEPVEAQVLRADAALLDCTGSPVEEVERRARAYWSGTSERTPTAEVLLEGTYRITRIVRPRSTVGQASVG